MKREIRKIFSHHKYTVILTLLLFIGAFLRFYNAPLRYSLGEESVRDAMVAIVGANSFQAPITGPFSSLGPFTFGPWYWYQLILFHIILPSGYSSWIYLGLLSLGYIVIIYKIGEEIQGKLLGSILAVLATFSPSQIASATLLTNPQLVHFFAVLSIYAFLRLFRKGADPVWAAIMGVSIGIGMNVHYQMLAYGILPFIVLATRYKMPKYFLLALLGIGVTFIPLLLFDLNNEWQMTRNIIFSYMDMKNRIYVPNSWTIYLRDFWPTFWSETLGTSLYISLSLISLSLIILSFVSIKKKLSMGLISLLVTFLIMFIQLRYYSGERVMGYLYYLQPLVFLLTGYSFFFLTTIRKIRYVGFVLFFLLISIILPSSLGRLKSEPGLVMFYEFYQTTRDVFPSEKVEIYHCEGVHKGGTMSLLFLLEANKALGESENKVGFQSRQCPTRAPIIKGSLVDLSLYSEKDLESFGWYRMQPKDIYDTSTKWWYKNLEHP